MRYIVNIGSGAIHDASKKHAKKYTGEKYVTVNTMAEAKSEAKRHGQTPHPCKKCAFNFATAEECKE